MPCALPATIMSTEYAQEGNQRGSSVSTTSGDDMSDDQTKVNSNSSTPTTFSRASPLERQELPCDLVVPSARPHHSFSIDALVGNIQSCETTKVARASDTIEPCTTESWPSHQLIDLKRIQAYYQQLYSQNFPLKQLNNYLYPHLSGIHDNDATKLDDARQQDQLLAYYANLYLQNSAFYQERYFESLKAFSNHNTSVVRSTLKNTLSSETFQRLDKSSTDEGSSQEVAQRTLPKRTEKESKDTSQQASKDSVQRDRYLTLNNHSTGESFLCSPIAKETSSPGTASAGRQLPPSSLYSPVEKSVDLAASNQANLHSGFAQHLFGTRSASASMNGSSFYPPYCDYDLLVKSKSNLLTGGSSDAATQNSFRSPVVDSNGPSPGGGGNPAAAAAFHLSNMFRKPKRIRTAFSPGQLLRLEEIFEKNRYVVGCERKQLARDLNLSETQIKVWFQNRRTKHKREKHVGVSQSGEHHSLHPGTSYHGEEKTASSAVSSLASTSSSSSTYLSNGNGFAIAPSSTMYDSHFKGQNNTHRTLRAK